MYSPGFPIACSNVSVQARAISLVRNLLSSHDADPRYKDPEVRARVATLYLPLLGIVLGRLFILYCFCAKNILICEYISSGNNY